MILVQFANIRAIEALTRLEKVGVGFAQFAYFYSIILAPSLQLQSSVSSVIFYQNFFILTSCVSFRKRVLI